MPIRSRFSTISAAVILAFGAPAIAADVDFQRLLKADSKPGSWMTYHGNYSGWYYSTLSEINAGNVNKLNEAWSHVASRSVRGLQSPASRRWHPVLLRFVQSGLWALSRQAAFGLASSPAVRHGATDGGHSTQHLRTHLTLQPDFLPNGW